jgi:RES domain-containing protein
VETLAHAPDVRYEDLPRYWLSQIEIPDSLRSYTVEDMPDYWQDKTYDQTQQWQHDWLENPDVLAVGLPSVIVPFSHNIIIHPEHPLFSEVRLLSQQLLLIDERIWRK